MTRSELQQWASELKANADAMASSLAFADTRQAREVADVERRQARAEFMQRLADATCVECGKDITRRHPQYPVLCYHCGEMPAPGEGGG